MIAPFSIKPHILSGYEWKWSGPLLYIILMLAHSWTKKIINLGARGYPNISPLHTYTSDITGSHLITIHDGYIILYYLQYFPNMIG